MSGVPFSIYTNLETCIYTALCHFNLAPSMQHIVVNIYVTRKPVYSELYPFTIACQVALYMSACVHILSTMLQHIAACLHKMVSKMERWCAAAKLIRTICARI